MTRSALALVALCLLFLFTPASEALADPVDVIVDFDSDAGEFPEGIAIARDGTIYLSLALASEIVALAPDGTLTSVALLPPPGGGFLVGIAVDRRSGDIIAALASFEPSSHGVWRIGTDGTVDFIGPMGLDTLPNQPAFDPRGNLYVTDSFGGAIYQVGGGAAHLWTQDPLLLGGEPVEPFPFSVGANGLTYRRGAFYVANTLQATVIRVPIGPKGAAGAAELFAADPLLFGADGMAFDTKGNLFVGANAQNHIARVTPDGAVDVFVSPAAGLYFPASVAFGTGRGDRKTLFITNFAFFGGPTQLVSHHAPSPGQPVP